MQCPSVAIRFPRHYDGNFIHTAKIPIPGLDSCLAVRAQGGHLHHADVRVHGFSIARAAQSPELSCSPYARPHAPFLSLSHRAYSWPYFLSPPRERSVAQVYPREWDSWFQQVVNPNTQEHGVQGMLPKTQDAPVTSVACVDQRLDDGRTPPAPDALNGASAAPPLSSSKLIRFFVSSFSSCWHKVIISAVQ